LSLKGSGIFINDNLIPEDQVDYEPQYAHKPLTLTLKFSMHRRDIEHNSDNQRNLYFEKSKVNISLKDLNSK
jgi:hypothetical protein